MRGDVELVMHSHDMPYEAVLAWEWEGITAVTTPAFGVSLGELWHGPLVYLYVPDSHTPEQISRGLAWYVRELKRSVLDTPYGSATYVKVRYERLAVAQDDPYYGPSSSRYVLQLRHGTADFARSWGEHYKDRDVVIDSLGGKGR